MGTDKKKTAMSVSIIVAATENNVIGRNNQLLWKLPNDMKWFKSLTTGHTVVMGRKTYESIGRTLPNRQNIVVSHNATLHIEGCRIAGSLEEALQQASGDGEVFVMGGGEIYKQAWDIADKLYLTRVHTHIDGDTMIPEISPEQWIEESRLSHPPDGNHAYAYTFITYRKKN